MKFSLAASRRLGVSVVACSIAICALALSVGSCAAGRARPPAGTSQPDKFLFDRGTEALNDRKWLNAREYFRELVDSYPQSQFRADAKLGIADSYLGEGTTEAKILAINEYREFLTFFPTHQRADYAQYKLAMAHYYQMLNPQRDQTETKAAIQEFDVFLDRYPNSPLMPEVRTRRREAMDRLADADYQVGVFYYRNRWYPGAVERFKALLVRDPEYTNRDAVYYHLGESLMRLQRPAEALPYYERLVKEFERSEYLDDAQKRVAELKPRS
ncbi:MAG TPA: outer membrane protein assembly factor BamD [Vicinamibacterales bacterium]|nr:outer membrane protein assembly factor BamD [Vicinamibacterales bacterium]